MSLDRCHLEVTCFLIYLITALTGYLSFGAWTQGDILKNLTSSKYQEKIAKALDHENYIQLVGQASEFKESNLNNTLFYEAYDLSSDFHRPHK